MLFSSFSPNYTRAETGRIACYIYYIPFMKKYVTTGVNNI